MTRFPIAKDALPYIAILLLASIVFYFIFPYLLILSLPLFAFTIFFFRNPPRKIPIEEGIIVSPADGTIMSISEIYEQNHLNTKAYKISIFLSVFSVHINRSPIEGVVKNIEYRPGKFLPAYKTHASDLNERNTLLIEGKHIKVLVHQITGLIARRIVCWVKTGDRLDLGQRFGLIKFGSCTEIIVPDTVQLKVQPGQKVRGAKTIIGVIG